MHNEGTLSALAHASVGSVVMDTAAECYAMAELCEEQAATVHSPQARQILREVAATWRSVGATLTARPPSN